MVHCKALSTEWYGLGEREEILRVVSVLHANEPFEIRSVVGVLPICERRINVVLVRTRTRIKDLSAQPLQPSLAGGNLRTGGVRSPGVRGLDTREFVAGHESGGTF